MSNVTPTELASLAIKLGGARLSGATDDEVLEALRSAKRIFNLAEKVCREPVPTSEDQLRAEVGLLEGSLRMRPADHLTVDDAAKELGYKYDGQKGGHRRSFLKLLRRAEAAGAFQSVQVVGVDRAGKELKERVIIDHTLSFIEQWDAVSPTQLEILRKFKERANHEKRSAGGRSKAAKNRVD
jgi:hypothetical protein